MKVKIILNPYANRWGAQRRTETIKAALAQAGVDYDLAVTTRAHEGTLIAEQAARADYDAIVAAGGDGTINEVVSGVLRAAGDGVTKPFGIVPLGSANDFSLMAGIPLDLLACSEVIAAAHTRQIDAGKVNDRFFINNSAVAMEPTITLENIKIKRISGQLRYVVALVRAIVKLKAWDMHIEWDGGGYDGPAYLLSVCNTARTGGFMIAPGAEMDDGLFDIVFAPEIPKRQVLTFLGGLVRGTHIHQPAVTFTRTSWLNLTSSPGTPAHADGEVFGEAITELKYQILPGKVTLICPASSGR